MVVQAEQSTEDEATGGEGNRWKDRLQPRRRIKVAKDVLPKDGDV